MGGQQSSEEPIGQSSDLVGAIQLIGNDLSIVNWFPNYSATGEVGNSKMVTQERIPDVPVLFTCKDQLYNKLPSDQADPIFYNDKSGKIIAAIDKNYVFVVVGHNNSDYIERTILEVNGDCKVVDTRKLPPHTLLRKVFIVNGKPLLLSNGSRYLNINGWYNTSIYHGYGEMIAFTLVDHHQLYVLSSPNYTHNPKKKLQTHTLTVYDLDNGTNRVLYDQIGISFVAQGITLQQSPTQQTGTPPVCILYYLNEPRPISADICLRKSDVYRMQIPDGQPTLLFTVPDVICKIEHRIINNSEYFFLELLGSRGQLVYHSTSKSLFSIETNVIIPESITVHTGNSNLQTLGLPKELIALIQTYIL